MLSLRRRSCLYFKVLNHQKCLISWVRVYTQNQLSTFWQYLDSANSTFLVVLFHDGECQKEEWLISGSIDGAYVLFNDSLATNMAVDLIVCLLGWWGGVFLCFLLSMHPVDMSNDKPVLFQVSSVHNVLISHWHVNLLIGWRLWTCKVYSCYVLCSRCCRMYIYNIITTIIKMQNKNIFNIHCCLLCLCFHITQTIHSLASQNYQNVLGGEHLTM